MENEEIIKELFTLLTELDARECSCNCIISSLEDVGWNDICDKGIDLQKTAKNAPEFFRGDELAPPRCFVETRCEADS